MQQWDAETLNSPLATGWCCRATRWLPAPAMAAGTRGMLAAAWINRALRSREQEKAPRKAGLSFPPESSPFPKKLA